MLDSWESSLQARSPSLCLWSSLFFLPAGEKAIGRMTKVIRILAGYRMIGHLASSALNRTWMHKPVSRHIATGATNSSLYDRSQPTDRDGSHHQLVELYGKEQRCWERNWLDATCTALRLDPPTNWISRGKKVLLLDSTNLVGKIHNWQRMWSAFRSLLQCLSSGKTKCWAFGTTLRARTWRGTKLWPRS